MLFGTARLSSSIDTSVDPCDDFYQFACGGWIEKHPVPEGASHVDQFQLLKDQSKNKIREILEADNSDLKGNPLMQARSLYRSCLDEDKIEKKGVEPILEVLRSLGLPQVPTLKKQETFSWQGALVNAEKMLGDSIFFSLDVIQHPLDSSKHVLQVQKGSIEKVPETKCQGDRDTVEAFIADYINMFIKHVPGVTVDAKRMATEIYAFHSELGNMTTDAGHYLEMTASELQEITDSHISTNSTNRFNWSVYFNQVLDGDENTSLKRKEKDGRIIVRDQQYFERWSRLFQSSSPEMIEMYIWWRVFSSLAPYTTREFQMRQQKFWQKVGGTRIITPRWKVCLEMVNKAYGYIVNFEYAKIHLDKDLREQALWLVSEIKEFVKGYEKELNWMDSETKKQGLKKIESLRANVVNHDEPLFPSKLEQFYSLINFVDGDLFELHLKILSALEASKLNSLYLTPKKEPALVYDSDQSKANVHYDPETNSISIPVSLLQPPMHDLRNSRVEFAAISPLISFEITRVFNIGHVKRFKEVPICNENHYESNTTIASKLQDEEIQMWCSNTSPTSVNDLLTGRSMVLGTLSKTNEFRRAWGCPMGSKMNPW
ncbi:endothelin-converting enzyme 2-like [Cloeon dipterum]|uniref:endothelin-converting enzyme 2-like n=1 Tax=Cloeon dipterum TaxID=197152 RepID=UPI0032209632